MRFYIDLGQLVEDVKSGVKELRSFVKESKQEFSEVMTDGFVEIVIKKNSNYQTSSEKRNRAYLIIDKAKENLTDRVLDIRIYAQQTEKVVNEFYEYKSEYFDKILSVSNSYLKSFSHTDDSNRLPTGNNLILHKIPFDSSEKFSEKTFNNFLVKVTLPPAVINLFEQKHRVEKSDSFLQEAFLFEERVNAEIAELNSMEVRLKHLQLVIDEEKLLLSRLYKKVQSTIIQLKKIENNTSATLENLNKINELTNVIELLRESMNMVFTTKSLNVTPEYKRKMKLIQAYI